jgi:hypothetical protein
MIKYFDGFPHLGVRMANMTTQLMLFKKYGDAAISLGIFLTNYRKLSTKIMAKIHDVVFCKSCMSYR